MPYEIDVQNLDIYKSDIVKTGDDSYCMVFTKELNNMEQELKYGDKVLFTTISGAINKIEGQFVGYSSLDKTRCIVEYRDIWGVKITYAETCEKKPEPKKRLMTAKELAGKWIRQTGGCGIYLVSHIIEDEVFLPYPMASQLQKVSSNMECTSTPADDSSWKSVLVDE